MKTWISRTFFKLVQPHSTNEERSRREFILNVLLIASSAFIFLSLLISSIDQFTSDPTRRENNGLSLGIIFVVFLSFVALRVLSLKGYARTAASALIGIFYLLTSYIGLQWGVDVQATLLMYALIIVISGILVSSRFSFFISLFITGTMLVINYLHRTNVVVPNRIWTSELWRPAEIIAVGIIFGIITVTSWLYNREVKKALARARTSEVALKEERDSLEIKVKERTRDLKITEMERTRELFRFAEFGRLSSGLFHDLTNQITALSLNMEKISDQTKHLDTRAYVDKALEVSEKMKLFVDHTRKQMAGGQKEIDFSVDTLIAQAVDVLSYKARAAKVTLRFVAKTPVTLHGDPTKLNQAITNLVSNAIDAYANTSSTTREVTIELKSNPTECLIIITDHGCGIPESLRSKIFEPFFTTKDLEHGTGIGLSITQRMVEHDFHGTITVASKEHEYTTFTITLPLTHHATPSHTTQAVA